MGVNVRFLLFFCIFLNTLLNATVDVPLSHLTSELGEEPDSDFGLRDRIRNFYHEARYDTINPHAPFSVNYWPVEIELPDEHQVPRQFLQEDGTVRLDKISHYDIAKLSDDELYNLLGPLSQVKVKVQWKDRAGGIGRTKGFFRICPSTQGL